MFGTKQPASDVISLSTQSLKEKKTNETKTNTYFYSNLSKHSNLILLGQGVRHKNAKYQLLWFFGNNFQIQSIKEKCTAKYNETLEVSQIASTDLCRTLNSKYIFFLHNGLKSRTSNFKFILTELRDITTVLRRNRCGK